MIPKSPGNSRHILIICWRLPLHIQHPGHHLPAGRCILPQVLGLREGYVWRGAVVFVGVFETFGRSHSLFFGWENAKGSGTANCINYWQFTSMHTYSELFGWIVLLEFVRMPAWWHLGCGQLQQLLECARRAGRRSTGGCREIASACTAASAIFCHWWKESCHPTQLLWRETESVLGQMT